LGPPERAFAVVAAIVVAIALVFWSTSASMVAVWNASGTYSHGYFIVPAFLWLVWGRRQTLALLPVAPAWWALLPLAILAGGWLIAQWMVLAQPAQFVMVSMVPLAIVGVLGVAWIRALAFPLAFLYFAVPFGESWVPVLMDWTADFTVAALRASGVPVYRDGLHFDIPSGKWSVVDSCSGIRYLFACLAVSSLYAWTIYRSTWRRLLFIGFALVLAIVANWLRAYGIVLLGHLSNNEIATGADHLVYGALFFGVIMALVFGLGVLWREPVAARSSDHRSEPDEHPATQRASEGAASSRWVPAALATAAILVIGPLTTIGTGGPSDAAVSHRMREIEPRSGWSTLAAPLSSWKPLLHNPALIVSGAYAKADQAVGLHVGVFHQATADSKLTSSRNRLLEADGLDQKWKLSQQGSAPLVSGGETVSVRTAVLIGNEGRLVAWQWYWVDGQITSDPAHAAWLQMLARLHGRGQQSAWIAIHTREEGDAGSAARTLAAFMADMGPAIDASLGRAAAGAEAISLRD
jgi:exosortase A